MSFLGRYLKGDVVSLAFQSKTAAGVPTLPDAVPSVIIYSDTASLKTKFVPVQDRYVLTAFFLLPLFLDANFAAGRYHAVFNYSISGTPLRETYEFEVLSLGGGDGAGIALAMMEMPHADYAVQWAQGGRIKKLRNPRSV